MRSTTTDGFRGRLGMLPVEVRDQANRAYTLWSSNPHHPGLQFKRVSVRQPIYSVRVGLGHRALGLWEEDVVAWFWIGSHAEYDTLLARL